MKKILIFAFAATILAACTKTNPTDPEPETQTSDLKIYLVDTLKINRLNLDGSGSKQIISRPQSTTKSAFIADVSANSPVSKIAYWVRNGNPGAYISELHLANSDGSNDKIVKSFSLNDMFPKNVKLGHNGLIYYSYTSGTSQAHNIYSIKEDGTGETKIGVPMNGVTDISTDGKATVAVYQSGGKTQMVYYDMTGDGGAGSPKYIESNKPGMLQARISADGKKLVALFTESGALKCQFIDLATRTFKEYTIVANIPADVFGYHISLAPDNDHVLCITSGLSTSTSYVYSQSAGKVVQQFNNAKGIYMGHIF